MAATTMMRPAVKGFPTNCAPEGAAERDLPAGFLEFFLPLHKRFAARHRQLVQARRDALEESLRGIKPAHLFPSTMTRDNWRIEVPDWCRDQRNQMTGPADEAELVVKMLNSGAPGVMLDLEDSMVNEWDHQRLGVKNILQALRGTLTYQDAKRGGVVGIRPSKTVIWIRARGLHLHQAGVSALTSTTITAIDAGSVTGYGRHGEPWSAAYDGIVLVTQQAPQNTVYAELASDPGKVAAAGISGLYCIGDAVAPRMISEAIFDGHRLAREIDHEDPAQPSPYQRERANLT